MFLLINGSFGIGKTTLAKRLSVEVQGAVISDPEDVGFVLRRLPPILLGLKRQPDDYQDMALWRRLIVVQARLRHMGSRVVLVPMAFTDRSYFAALEAALLRTAPVQKICLVAPLETVRERLEARAAFEGRALDEFEIRRSTECVAAHVDPFFGVRIDATQSLDMVAAEAKALITGFAAKPGVP